MVAAPARVAAEAAPKPGQYRAITEAADQYQYHPSAERSRPPARNRITQSSEPVTLETNKGFADAAAAVGWTVSIVPEGTGPEDPAKALGQASTSTRMPIFVSGQTLYTMRAQIERAKAENIPVFQSDSGEPVQGREHLRAVVGQLPADRRLGEDDRGLHRDEGQQAHPRRRLVPLPDPACILRGRCQRVEGVSPTPRPRCKTPRSPT